jgi:beta-aspartyl-peptidase (threonine type)
MVHGGADTKCSAECLAALRQAALAGWQALTRGTVDAVEQAVISIEDDPLFNAGCGSVLNLEGEVEMDASIMDGASAGCGAVAAIKSVRHPVSVARQVMEQTPHVMLAGAGAVRFARAIGWPEFDPVTEQRRSAWRRAVIGRQGSSRDRSDSHSCGGDTVGCVAVLGSQAAAASSTGGIFLKLPGRVGDTSVIGAGVLATTVGAAVCTGDGEAIIEIRGAGAALDLLERGASAAEAAQEVIIRLNRRRAAGGILVVDTAGNAAAAHNGRCFPIVLVIDGRVVEDFIPVKIERE